MKQSKLASALADRRHKLALLLRQERVKYNLSETELADKLVRQTGNPYTGDVISKMERGKREVKFVEVEDFATVFEVRVDHFRTRAKSRVQKKSDIVTTLKNKGKLIARKAKSGKERFVLVHSGGRREGVSQRRCRALLQKGRLQVFRSRNGETTYILKSSDDRQGNIPTNNRKRP